MADAATTRYAFVKPEVGASADTWGTKWNTNNDDYDALLGAITTTGSAAAYVLTTGLSLAAYVAGQSFLIKASFTCNAAATVNVDTLGAKNITKNGTTATVSGDIVSGNIYRISYDGTQFQMSEAAGAGAQPLDATLTALAAGTTGADVLFYWSGTDTLSTTTLTSAARTVLDDTTVGAMCTTLGAANVATDVTYTDTDWRILANTSDGADSSIIRIAGGGAAGATRGAYITLQGNEYGSSGLLQLFGGDAAGGVTINSSGGPLTLTGAATATTMKAAAPVSSETTGTLTSASSNATVNATGGVTINDGVHTAGDRIEIYAGASARTITQDTGMTLRLDGTATTGNRTLAARGRMSVYFVSSTEAICSGAGVT